MTDQMKQAAETIPESIVVYDVTEAYIAAEAKRCADMSADTTAGYEEVRLAIAGLRSTRVEIEVRRKKLKADSIAWGRKVDGAAKHLTALIAAIEAPLKIEKAKVDDARAVRKRAAEDAKRDALEARIKAAAQEEAAARAVESKRLAEESARLAAERKKLEAERAALARQQREAQEAIEAGNRRAKEARDAAEEESRKKLEAKRADIAAEREALEQRQRKAEQEEADRVVRAQAEKDAAERAETERVAAEERAVAEAERLAELERRRAALRPDAERLSAWADAIEALPRPELSTEAGALALKAALELLSRVCVAARDIGGTGAAKS